MAGVERPDVTAPTRRGDALAHRMPEAIRLGWRRVRPWVQSTWFLSLVLAAIAWPGRVSVLPPQAGLTIRATPLVAMAAHQQLPFGTRIVFTFGPLGFLNGPALYYANTAILAFIFRFGVAAATYAVLLSATRRYVRLVVAVPVAYVAGFALIGLIPTDEAALGIAFALCVDRLSRPAGDSEGEWKWTALGALAGLFALEKLSIGLGIAVLCAIAVWCVPGRRRRALALTAVPAFSVFVVGWFATGNRIGNLVAYRRRVLPDCVGIHGDGVRPDARSSQHVDPRRGRGDRDRRHRGRGHAGRLAAVAPAYDGGFWKMLIAAPAPVGLLLASAFTTWLLFKEAFVRQDTHRLIFLSSVPLLLAGFVYGARRDDVPGTREPWLTRRHGVNLVASLLIFSFFGFEVLGVVPISLTDPAGAIGGFAATVRTLVVPGRRHDLMTTARANSRRCTTSRPR